MVERMAATRARGALSGLTYAPAHPTTEELAPRLRLAPALSLPLERLPNGVAIERRIGRDHGQHDPEEREERRPDLHMRDGTKARIGDEDAELLWRLRRVAPQRTHIATSPSRTLLTR
jgi:hypothetical protein